MNEVKFKLWQVWFGLIATVLGIITAFYMGLSYDLEKDKYRFEQYKQSYFEWNEDRKQQTDQEPQG